MLLSTQCFIGITPNPQDSYITNDKKSDHHIKRGLQNEIEGFKKTTHKLSVLRKLHGPSQLYLFSALSNFLRFSLRG